MQTNRLTCQRLTTMTRLFASASPTASPGPARARWLGDRLVLFVPGLVVCVLTWLCADFGASLAPAQENLRQPYWIGAWYFTAWSCVNTGQQPGSSEKVYGRYDPWGGVRDHALGADPWSLGQDYSSREPLLGFYDMMSQEIVDAHIKMAASRGLSYFAYYWYWDTDIDEESGASKPIHRFITSRYKGYLRFLIAPIMLGKAPMTLSSWQNKVVPYLVKQYVRDPSYLRVGARPVIVDFALTFDNNADHRLALAILRRAVFDAVRADPVILSLAHDRAGAADLYRQRVAFRNDGFACFHFPAQGPGEPYRRMAARYVPIMEKHNQPYYIPCATTGFDARPWYHVGWKDFAPPNDGVNGRPFATGMSVEIFEAHLREMRKYLDAHPRQTSKMLTIFAWNEWGEGGIIEPSVTLGYRYLDAVMRAFGLHSVLAEPAISDSRATFIGQQAPHKLAPGQIGEIAVTMANRGKTTWTKKKGFVLEYWGFRDGAGGPGRSAAEKLSLAESEEIPPGQQKTFKFLIKAPATGGAFKLQCRMAEDDGSPFGDFTPCITIEVPGRAGAAKPHGSPKPSDRRLELCQR
jgi:Glycosyltransferase WbsX